VTEDRLGGVGEKRTPAAMVGRRFQRTEPAFFGQVISGAGFLVAAMI
jgi:hypothetical protein